MRRKQTGQRRRFFILNLPALPVHLQSRPFPDDLRFAFRQLLKSPGFTVLAVLTLALGIGLNTAIFSLINDLFLRGLPFKEPDRLVDLYPSSKDRDFEDFAISAPRFIYYRDGQTIFDGFAGENPTGLTMTGVGEPVRIPAFRVTLQLLRLARRAAHPRPHLPPAGRRGADVALVTENFWKKRLGSDRTCSGAASRSTGGHHRGVLPNMPVAWSGRNRRSGRPSRSSFPAFLMNG